MLALFLLRRDKIVLDKSWDRKLQHGFDGLNGLESDTSIYMNLIVNDY